MKTKQNQQVRAEVLQQMQQAENVSQQSRILTRAAALKANTSLSSNSLTLDKVKKKRNKQPRLSQSSGENALKSSQQGKKLDVKYDLKALEDSLMENLAKVVKRKDLEIVKINSENEDLVRRFEEVKRKFEIVENENEIVLETLKVAEQDLKSSRSECLKVTDENKALSATNSQLGEEKNELRGKNNELESQVDEMEGKQKSLVRVLRSMEVEVKETEARHEKELEERNREESQLLRKNDDLKNQVIDLLRMKAEEEKVMKEKDEEIMRLKAAEEKVVKEMDEEILRLKDAKEKVMKEKDEEILRLKDVKEKVVKEKDEEILRLKDAKEKVVKEKDEEILRLNAALESLKSPDSRSKRQIQDSGNPFEDHSYVKRPRLLESPAVIREEESPKTRENDSDDLTSSHLVSEPVAKPVLKLRCLSSLRANESELQACEGRQEGDNRAEDEEEQRSLEFKIMRDVDRLKKDVAGNVRKCLMKVYGKEKSLLRTESDFSRAARNISVRAREEIKESYLMTHENLAGITLTEEDRLNKIVPGVVAFLIIRSIVEKSLMLAGTPLSETLIYKFVEEFQDKIQFRGRLSEEDIRRDYEHQICTSIQHPPHSSN